MISTAPPTGALPPAAPPTASPIPRFALVTPSYYVDFQRCRWLCETVDRFVPTSVPHYLIVDRADRQLFAPLASARTRLIFKEDVLQGKLRQVPFARRWWVGTRSLPVRGWIVQQIVKLSMHEVAKEDALVFVDSGSFFVRDWEPSSMLRGSAVPLFYNQGPFFRDDEGTRRWHRFGAKVLGIRPQPGVDLGYIDALVVWRRDNLVMLQRHIERVTGAPMFDSLARAMTVSEYHLYGMYCDYILGERSGHYRTAECLSVAHWMEESLDHAQLTEQLGERLGPEHVLILINEEKSGTDVEAVRRSFGYLVEPKTRAGSPAHP